MDTRNAPPGDHAAPPRAQQNTTPSPLEGWHGGRSYGTTAEGAIGHAGEEGDTTTADRAERGRWSARTNPLSDSRVRTCEGICLLAIPHHALCLPAILPAMPPNLR